MILAVDVGNSDMKFGVFDGKKLAVRWALHSDPDRTRQEYTDLIGAMLSHFGVDGIEGAVVGSVVPILTPVVADAVSTLSEQPPIIPTAQETPGIRLRVDAPEQVGVDRVANALAAREEYGVPAIVADMGSATTFDVVDANGDLIGVVIAPGIRASARALAASAAQLPDFQVVKPAAPLGTNTVASMQSGVYWGYVHLVRGFVQQLRAQVGDEARAIATGGTARDLIDDTGVFDVVDPDLTLKGLLLMKTAMESAE